MVAYVALTWNGEPPAAVVAARTALAEAGDWKVALEEAGRLLAVRGPVVPRVRRLPCGRGWVIGDLFRRSFRGGIGDEIESAVMSRRFSAEATARELSDHYWGRYVAIIEDLDPYGLSVFRDPSGAVEAMTWAAGGLTVVGSHLPDWLPDVAWPDLAIDWDQVRRWTISPSAVALASGLIGLASVTPGAWRRCGGPERQVWTPAAAAGRTARPAAEAAASLPPLVDACVGAFAGEAGAILAEVSGGLDSAIVAASLARTSHGKVRQWLNYRAAEGQGDERAFAQDVATLWDFPLTEAIKPPFALDADLLEAAAGGFRPGFSALDLLRDRDVANRVAELGVDRVVTGQGGDMVFFQTPTPVVAVDHLRRAGLRGLASSYLLEVSRWTRQSVWRTMATALDSKAAWPGERTVADHPWMADAGDLPPGKRSQIAVLAQKLTLNIENLRARQAEILHPLLAQPVVEHCLAVSAADLTVGGRDRGLARTAFAERLPASIRERRAKGELTAYYGRMVAASLAFLRPYLLEGRLAGEGLLDRERFAVMLTREQLIWRGDYAAIITAATIEAWVRHWEAVAAGRRSQG
ncbi:asparagine synthase C-terminal domain-containing protein [Phenylobacterium sp.]|uniref:asparagine synthase C-terminal domain-containing protein n=1 Tax=Phenylobacterium sp. TaxID=1871053 RepID=UPI002FCA8D8D